MSNQFYPLKVSKIQKETDDCVSITLNVPTENKEDFAFKAGQYLTFKTTINGEEIRRSYSICKAPHENELCVAVKQIHEGLFSTYANEQLSVGDTLEAMPPMGLFTSELDSNNQKNYVFFAAGSGITPVIAIVKDILANEPNSFVTLFYGNKGFNSTIFREEWIDLKNMYTNNLSTHFIFSREGLGNNLYKGRIDAEKAEKLLSTFAPIENQDEFFMCGPEEMILAVKDILIAKNVEPNKIHFELFNTSKGKKRAKAAADNRPQQDCSVKIILDGDEIEFGLSNNGDTILDAAQKIGADLPYACKGGVCCTCKAKVLEGEVSMDVNYALEQDQLDQGFVLTCQAHPISEKVVIDFDEM